MPNLHRMVSLAAVKVLARSLARLPPAARSGLAREIMDRRRDDDTRLLAGFFERARFAWRNRQYDIRVNGEEELFRRIAPFNPRVVLDVGANVGDWTLAAVRHLPEATAHAFEIASTTAAQLLANVGHDRERVRVNAIGLADREVGEVELFVVSGDNTATSTLHGAALTNAAMRGAMDITRETGRVTTGDRYLEQSGIEHVDVLKIDVEGAESTVLRGFEAAFKRRAVTLVQFEYGFTSLDSKFLLADFYRFFSERGFILGKLLPDGVAFKAYEAADEDFIGPNYVACLESRADLVAALRCEPLTVA